MSVIAALLDGESREIVADALLEPFVTLHDDPPLFNASACQRHRDGSNVLRTASDRAPETLINPSDPDERRAVLYGIGAVLLWSTVATGFKLGLRGTRSRSNCCGSAPRCRSRSSRPRASLTGPLADDRAAVGARLAAPRRSGSAESVPLLPDPVRGLRAAAGADRAAAELHLGDHARAARDPDTRPAHVVAHGRRHARQLLRRGGAAVAGSSRRICRRWIPWAWHWRSAAPWCGPFIGSPPFAPATIRW